MVKRDGSVSNKDFRTITSLEVLRRSHAFLIKMIVYISTMAILGLVAAICAMQQGQAKAIASVVNAIARMSQ